MIYLWCLIIRLIRGTSHVRTYESSFGNLSRVIPSPSTISFPVRQSFFGLIAMGIEFGLSTQVPSGVAFAFSNAYFDFDQIWRKETSEFYYCYRFFLSFSLSYKDRLSTWSTLENRKCIEQCISYQKPLKSNPSSVLYC